MKRKEIRDEEHRDEGCTFAKNWPVRRVEKRNTSCKEKWGQMRVFVFILLLLFVFFLREKSNNRVCMLMRDPIKGKINDVGQSSANYLAHGLNLTC